jgi:hypothetical protein
VEVPGIIITESDGSTTVKESDTTDSYEVVLTSQPIATVTIAITSSNTSEVAATAQLAFTASNWDTPQEVTVTGQDDDVDDPGTCTTPSAACARRSTTRLRRRMFFVTGA